MPFNEIGTYTDLDNSGSPIHVCRYTTAELSKPRGSSSLGDPGYSDVALDIAQGMRTVHARVGVRIGAEALAKTVAGKSGVLYVAQGMADANHGMLGYAYLEDGSQQQLITCVDECEVTVGEIGDRRCDRVAAAILDSVFTDISRPFVMLRGRVAISETRPLTFFTNDLGCAMPAGFEWGQPGAFVLGRTEVVQARAAQLAGRQTPVENPDV